MYKLMKTDGNDPMADMFDTESEAREWAFDEGGCKYQHEWEQDWIVDEYESLDDCELASLVYGSEADKKYPDNTYMDALLTDARRAGYTVIDANDPVHCIFYVH